MALRRRFVPHLTLAAVLLAAACSDGADADESAAATTSTPTTSTPTTSGTTTSEQTVAPFDGEFVQLPIREGPREETTYSVPHVQVYAEPVPEVDAELRRRAFLLPGVENRESHRSFAGTRSLWLADDIEVARPQVLGTSDNREFAHIHGNGSLHVWLPVERAIQVTETKWGELHPWVGRSDFWDGTVMVYTPETLEELDVTMQIIVDAYNHVTGSDLDPADFQ